MTNLPIGKSLSRLAFVAAVLAVSAILQAHEGHDHAPQPGDAATAVSGPIELTETAVANLGIETREAEIITLARSTNLVAQVEPLPENVAQITARFDGTIGEVFAKLGESVTSGQPLLRVIPRSIGNPDVILKSPLTGSVTSMNVTLGQPFSPDTVLAVIADYSKMLARGTAYENPDILNIKIGDPARLTLNVFPGKNFAGTIQRANIGLESDSKTFALYALLDNREGKLRPNLLGQLSVSIGHAEPVLAIPEQAILGDLGNYFVFVREGNAFEKRPTRIGLRAGGFVEIIEGIVPGEQVVTRGNYQLQFATSAATKKPIVTEKTTTTSSTWPPLLIGGVIGAAVSLLIVLLVPLRMKSRHV